MFIWTSQKLHVTWQNYVIQIYLKSPIEVHTVMISWRNLQNLAPFKKASESETVSTMTDYPEALFSNTDTVGIFNESDADTGTSTSFDFTILMPINAGDRIDKH